ncbi:Transglutaminase-like superfamily protein [Filimonas lacunae]|uniref:Transglutaminase-like superfamily protein n=1 Tax=Filimonas lacunae TaxID=477680 RepID=A0A1N7PG85_9BACT|nr:transglutaminase family protein [Filimonas lacunae]SIT09602.1 Transglutaminase-like superfamily protein [Filimonas lacunae]
MEENREISALFHLLDDPDEEVFSTVSQRIVDYGRNIIPNLENLWENSPREDMQTRIEMLIHRLHYTDLITDLTEWRDGAYHDLLFGALLVAKFQYPDLHTTPVLQEMEKIRRNVWLELNSYLTPLEQANVISSIVYNYYSLKGADLDYTNPDHFFIHQVLRTKKGNSVSNGILYLILAEQLDISVKAIHIPQQFVLAFFHTDYDACTYKGNPQHKIHFYVDGKTGQPFSHNDLELYFKRTATPAMPEYFKPYNHISIIQLLLEELSRCFSAPLNLYKQKELLELASLLH